MNKIIMLFCNVFVISMALYSNSSPVYNVSIPQNDNEQSTLTNKLLDDGKKLDSLTLIYSYWQDTIRRISVLLSKVSEIKLSVLPNEITERLVFHNELFPGIIIDSSDVEKEIIIEKYLTQHLSIAPSEVAVSNTSDEFISIYPLKNNIEQVRYSSLFRTRALFSMDTVSALVHELIEEERKKRFEEVAKINEPRPIEEMSINADENICLAINPDDGGCLVSVGQFNAFASIEPVSPQNDLRTDRSVLMRRYLEMHFLSNKIKTDNMRFSERQIEAEVECMENDLLLRNSRFKKRYDEKILLDAYDKYFQRFFDEKLIQQVGIIGSSDSVYIDSIYKRMIAIDSDRSGKTAAVKHNYLKSLPWIFSSTEVLPDTIVFSIDDLKSQNFKRISTPFGFFLVRVIKRKRRLKILFDEAYNKLVYLVDEDKSLSGGGDSIAMEIYNNNKVKYRTQDTILTEAWLLPVSENKKKYSSADDNYEELIAADTCGYQSMEVSSIDLPLLLLKDVFTDAEKGSLIGPFYTDVGKWIFHVKKVIRGGKQVPYDKARKEIMNEMEVRLLPIDKVSSNKNTRKLLNTKVLVNTYCSKRIEDWKNYANKNITKKNGMEMNKEIKNKRNEEKSSPVKPEMDGYMKAVFKERRDIRQWLKKVTVDSTVLYIGCQEYAKNERQ